MKIPLHSVPQVAGALAGCLLLAATVATAQTQSDIRIVSGVRVDLTPLHEWYLTNRFGTASRPLKHWKKLRVTTPKEWMAAWQRVVCMDEDRRTLDILVYNLPEGVLRFIEETKDLSKRIEDTQADVKRLEEYVSNKGANLRIAAGSLSDSDYAANLADLETAKANLRHRTDDLHELANQLSDMAERSAKELTIFAMFTGRMYSGLQVWDCGKSANQQSP